MSDIEIERDEEGRVTSIGFSDGMGCFLFVIGVLVVLAILNHC